MYLVSVTRIVGVYELPVELGAAASCFSRSFQANIADHQVAVHTPKITWVGDRPIVVAPDHPHLPSRRGTGIRTSKPEPQSWPDWGTVVTWDHRKRRTRGGWIRSVAVSFALPERSLEYSEYLHGVGHIKGKTVEAFFDVVDQWFLGLLTWVAVAVDQDTHHTEPLSGSEIPGEDLTLVAVQKDGSSSLPTSANEVRLALDSSELVPLGRLRSIIKLVNQGSAPDDAHLLLRDAMIDHRRGRHRKAVIDAGAATELALARWNKAHKTPSSTRLPTLGVLVRSTTAPIPP